MPEEEKHWLKNAIGLLLKSTHLSPDFNHPLFNEPLK
jgi:hypothetical protein